MNAAQKRDFGLEDLRYYLRQWSVWVRSWKPRLGFPGEACFLSGVEGRWSAINGLEDMESEVNGTILRTVDREIQKLAVPKRRALFFFYLNESGPAVYRSNRLTRPEVSQWCVEAELELLPVLRAKGIVLGGY